MTYETHEYGSTSEPSILVRSSIGEYFSSNSRSRRSKFLASWSTELSLADFYRQFQATFPRLKPDTRIDSSVVGLSIPPRQKNDPLEVLYEQSPDENRWVEFGIAPSNLSVIDVAAPEAIEIIKHHANDVQLVRIGFSRNIFVTWRKPCARFVDSDHEVSEAGLWVNSLTAVEGLRRFVRTTGSRAFFDEANICVPLGVRGRSSRIII